MLPFRRRLRSLCAAALAISVALAPGRSDAGDPEVARGMDPTPPPAAGDAPSGDGRVVRAVRRNGAISIDGVLDEPAWQAAEAQSDFWQRDPHQGQPPRFRTEFRVLYDDEALYVGVRAHDPDPGQIRALLTRRDVDSSSDWLWIGLDSYHDRRTAFAFGVNAAGVQADSLYYNDVEFDSSWDAVWESGTSIDDEGWAAELRIPYSQLRFSDAPEQVWGMQVLRYVERTREKVVWSPWPKQANQEVSLYGTLVGLSGISSGARLELLPYVLGGTRLYHAVDGDPFHDGADALGGLGLDVKAGLGSNFTLSGTINPDFGQVEADPSQVNLGANEIFLQEKRPFFLESTDIFRFGLSPGDGAVESLFYTRRIGAPPHGDVVGDATDVPVSTTIYGAGKLSGKTAGGWSVGLLDAVTGQETALVAVDGVDAHDRVVVEPLTNYAVGRVRKDLRGGRTSVGAAVTAVHQSLEDTKLDWLHAQAYTGGLEFSHRFWDEDWTADLRVVGSHVRGSPEAIDRTQRASQRYYQRPDASHLDYDPTRTSLSGAALLGSIGKTAGSSWRFLAGADARTPGFEANDLGFQLSADYAIPWLWLQYRDVSPGDLVQEYAVDANAWSVWNTAGDRLNVGGNLNTTVTLVNRWGGAAGVGADENALDPHYLRGGPMLRRDPSAFVWANLWSSTARRVHGTLNGSTFVVPGSDSHGYDLSCAVVVQARSNLELSLGPSFAVTVDDNQYVAEVQDSMGEAHYLLARLRQVTTALTLRASYTFSPALSVQLYAQPFVSGGRFAEYKDVVAPRAADYGDRYHVIDDDEVVSEVDGVRAIDRDGDGAADFRFSLADFNVRELRSNLVLRWEYRPGSTFFLIWSHGRTSLASNGRFSVADDVGALTEEGGEHVLLAKLNYWFGL